MSQWSFRHFLGLHHLAKLINSTAGLAVLYAFLVCSLSTPSQTSGVRYVAPLSDPFPDIPARGLRSEYGTKQNTALSTWNVFSRFIKRGQMKAGMEHKKCLASGASCGPLKGGCCAGAVCVNYDLDLCSSAKEFCICLAIPLGDKPY